MAGAESPRRSGAAGGAVSGGGKQGGASWERIYHRPLLLGGGLSALTRAPICLGAWSLRSVSHACVMEP